MLSYIWQGKKDTAIYPEGIFVGYRYYTSRKMKTAFPFGYGLSYTTFDYSGLALNKPEIDDTETLKVSVNVKNIENMAGKEGVQLYMAPPESDTIRPVRELRGFEKTSLEQGEEKTIEFTLDIRAFAYWNTDIHDWFVEDGVYKIQICKNADEVILEAEVTVHGTKKLPRTYTMDSCLGEIMREPDAQSIIAPFLQVMAQNNESSSGMVNKEMMAAMTEEMPLRELLSLYFVLGIEPQILENLLASLNK